MKSTSLKWEAKQRLRLLEATVLWGGTVRVKDLMRVFGISRAQASKDMARYKSMFPGNMIYDSSKKRYVPTTRFQPGFFDGSAREFLNLMRSSATGPEGLVLLLYDSIPPVEIVEPVERTVAADVLRGITRALREKRAVSVRYQSMNRKEPAKLVLSPHTLVHNGFRWHVRAYSDTHGEFRDFVLSRMRGSPKPAGPARRAAADDADWNRHVPIRLVPHPDLPAPQRGQLEDDYGMKDGALVQWVRAPLVKYFLRRMNLGSYTIPGLSPQRQQVVIANAAEVAQYDVR